MTFHRFIARLTAILLRSLKAIVLVATILLVTDGLSEFIGRSMIVERYRAICRMEIAPLPLESCSALSRSIEARDRAGLLPLVLFSRLFIDSIEFAQSRRKQVGSADSDRATPTKYAE